jgi:hypothetical protein
MKTSVASAFLMLLFAASVWASDDPFAGKWVLDVKQSEYPAGSCPTKMVIEIETAGHGVRYQSDAIYANGRTVHSEYTAEYDGNPAIVRGTRGLMLPVSLKRIDANTVIATYTRGLQVVATSRRVLSEDKRRMTITTVSKDSSSNNVTTVGVYERQ